MSEWEKAALSPTMSVQEAVHLGVATMSSSSVQVQSCLGERVSGCVASVRLPVGHMRKWMVCV